MMKEKTKFKQTEIGMIPEDWEIKSIKDIVKINERTINKDFRFPEIEYIDIDSVDNGIINNKQHFQLNDAPSRAKRIIRKNDIIISTVRPNLKHFAFIKEAKPNTIVSTGFAVISCKKVNSKFLYYYLTTDKVTDHLSAIADSHTSTYPSFNPNVIENLLAPYPREQEQERIAKILSDLDSKIELNQQMNKTLEEMGRTIFKRWFVDFEFPNEEGKPYKSSGGEMIYNEELRKEIPKGWRVVRLIETAEFTRGFSYSGSEKSKTDGQYVFITLNSVKEFGGFKREFSYLTSDRVKEKHFVQHGDIVIANTEQTKTGTLLGYPALVEFPWNYQKYEGVFSHHITKVTPRLKNFKHYLYHYLFLNQKDAVKYNTGSVIWALDVDNWSKNEKILLPHPEVLFTFDLALENMFSKISANNLQVETLSRIRDSLLPRLMSGKIRVPVEIK